MYTHSNSSNKNSGKSRIYNNKNGSLNTNRDRIKYNTTSSGERSSNRHRSNKDKNDDDNRDKSMTDIKSTHNTMRVNIEAELKIMITEEEVVQGVVIDPKIKTKAEE